MEEILHHLGWLKPYNKWWDNHHPRWCRIFSINSITPVIWRFLSQIPPLKSSFQWPCEKRLNDPPCPPLSSALPQEIWNGWWSGSFFGAIKHRKKKIYPFSGKKTSSSSATPLRFWNSFFFSNAFKLFIPSVKLTLSHLKMDGRKMLMVGRCISFWEAPFSFSGAILVFLGRVVCWKK